MAKYHYYIAAILSGLLLSLAYPGWFDNGQIQLSWLIWIGLVPLIWSLTHFTYKNDHFYMRGAFFVGFLAGLAYFLTIFRWFWSIHPLNTLGIDNAILSLIIVGAVYIISSVGMALFWGFWGIVLNFQFSIFPKNKKLFSIFCFLFSVPASFVLIEYARSWSFGILWAGSGSIFGPHWTMGSLAYSLTNNSLALKLASLTGIYSVTFWVVLTNCLIFIILKGGRLLTARGATLRKAALGVVVLLAVILGSKIIVPRVAEQDGAKKINYAIIQTSQPTNISPTPQEIIANLKEQLELLTSIAKEHSESQLVIFPEASDFFKNLSLFLTTIEAQKYFSKLFKEPRLIVSGGRTLDSQTNLAYSRAFSLDTQNDILSFYDKRLLVPGGEFLPYPIKILAQIFSKNSNIFFSSLRELNPGTKEISTVGFRYQFTIASLVCSELVSPTIARQTTQNADIVASMASYGVFHGNHTIANQMLATTRFRAAEIGKPILTAANMGRSYAIDSHGNMVFLAENSDSRILTGSIAINGQKTWYNERGDLPILLACLLIMLGFFFLIRFRNSRRP